MGLGVPRYVSAARLLRHRAEHGLGLAVDQAGVEADLDALDASAALESWWWTGDIAAEFGRRDWLTRAAARASRLADEAGPRGATLRAEANRRLEAWSAQ